MVIIYKSYIFLIFLENKSKMKLELSTIYSAHAKIVTPTFIGQKWAESGQKWAESGLFVFLRAIFRQKCSLWPLLVIFCPLLKTKVGRGEHYI